MKSLEDVIISIENCLIDPCPDCAIYVNDKCRKDEYTAYYLKEFQAMQDEIAALPDYYELVNFWAESQANPPLTWDELKTMEGKPVWVEYGIGFNQKRWVVIHSFHNTGSFCYMNVSGNYPDTFWQKDMGEDEFWQAYRKER